MPSFRSRHHRSLALPLLWAAGWLSPLATATLDVVFVLDTTKTAEPDFTLLQASMSSILSQIVNNVDSNTRFGIATFQDYAIMPFGIPGTDTPYERLIDLTSNRAAVEAAIQQPSLIGLGGDNAESGLAAVFQLLTGEGQDFGQSLQIPENQDMSFRSNAQKMIVVWTDSPFHDPSTSSGYPGPTFARVVQALTDTANANGNNPPVRLVGLSSIPSTSTSTSALVTSDLRVLTRATNAKATRDFTCYSNGGPTLTTGDDLICTGVSSLANSGTLTEAFVNIVREAYLIDNPDSSDSGSSSGGIACFSDQNSVVEKTRGTIRMDQVRVGDWLMTAAGSSSTAAASEKSSYSRVLSLAHYLPTQSAVFLQIYTNSPTTTSQQQQQPLEMTADHLLFVMGANSDDDDDGTPAAKRAGTLRPGDRLLSSNKDAAVVTRITTVQRLGIYAPVTESGHFLVQQHAGEDSGADTRTMVQVSSYVDVFWSPRDTTPLLWTVDAHLLGHIFYSPLRIYCRCTQWCEDPGSETYDSDTGYSNTYGAWMLPVLDRVRTTAWLFLPVFALCWWVEQAVFLMLNTTTTTSAAALLMTTVAATVLLVVGTTTLWSSMMLRTRGKL